MSRSRKHTPIFGYATGSDQWSKRKANRVHRHRVAVDLKKEREMLTQLREVSNVWGFQKDGKSYCAKATDRDLCK